MSNPYESPQTVEHSAPSIHTPTPLGMIAIFPCMVLTLGNQAAIFWGLEGFEYWNLPWYLPLFAKLSVASIVISVTMAAIVAWSVRLRRSDHLWTGVTLSFFAIVPSILVILLFPLIQYAAKGDLLIPIAILLVVSQAILSAFSSFRSLDRWFVLVACGTVCAISGVVLGIYQIVVCSLIT